MGHYRLSEQTLYQALIAQGMSSQQAAGVMGNMMSESGYDVEAAAMDSNGKMSYGLIQWNAGSYPSAGNLVTGNPTRDTQAQIGYLLHNTNNISLGLRGNSAAEIAGNFARYVEVCQGCQPGGSSYNQRVAQANQVYQRAMSGQWGSGPGVSGGTGSGSGSGSANPADFNTPASLTSTFLDYLMQKLGVPDAKDLAERFGLILMGGILVVVGIIIFGSGNAKTLINFTAPTPSGGSKKSGEGKAAGAAEGETAAAGEATAAREAAAVAAV